MNFEEAQRVKEKKAKKAKPSQAEQEAVSKKREETLNFLKTRRIFKDMLNGREDLFRQCKEFLYVNAVIQHVDLGGPISADFIAGFRYALETMESVASTYDVKLKEYNEMMGGNA